MKNLIKKYSGYMKNQKKEEKNLIELNKFAISNKNKLIQRDSCPLCKCKKSTFVYKAPIYNFVKCKKCELVYSKEIFKDEDVAKFYENNKIYQKSWKNHYSSLVKQKKANNIKNNSHVVQTVIKYSKNKNKCLDIGCGFGEILYQLKPHFNVIEGVELNSLSSKKGSELFDIKIYNDDLKNLSLKSNSYDCIILNQVIEHLNNFDLFDEIKRILKPGGIVYIGCPNMDSISMKFLKQRHIHTFTMVHLNMFNFKSFNYFSKKMGLRIISLKTDNFLDIWLNDLVGYFFNKKKFLHRFNDIYILNLFNVGLYMFSSYFFNKTNLLQKYKKGSYLEVILQKK